MKKTFSILLTVMAIWAVTVGCNKSSGNQEEQNQEQEQEQEQEEQEEEQELEPFQFSCTQGADNNIYSGKPVFNLHLENPNAVKATAEITLTISTDKNKKYVTVELEKEVAAGGSADISLTTEENMEPGFYKATGKVGKKSFLASAPFGIDPFQIVSAPDKQEDFETFWQAAYAQLKADRKSVV